jgi:hypothetical protein
LLLENNYFLHFFLKTCRIHFRSMGGRVLHRPVPLLLLLPLHLRICKGTVGILNITSVWLKGTAIAVNRELLLSFLPPVITETRVESLLASTNNCSHYTC